MMRSNSYATVRLLAVLLTVGVIAGHQYLPPRILQLYPSSDRLSWIYGPEHQGAPSAGWIDRENGNFWCNYVAGDIYSCGWSVNLGSERTTGVDLSAFDGFNIVIHYKGDSPRIRLYLRDFDSTYSDVNRFDVTSKVMSTAIRTSDLNKPNYVGLNEFSVAEWWVTEFDVARENSAPSLNNVIAFGIEFNVHSNSEVRVERIEAVGERIKKEALYFGIIFVWMIWIILDIILRFYVIRKRATADAQRIARLATEYKKLELEKQEFEVLSTTDVLTGVLNRAGVQQFLQRFFESDVSWSQVGVLLFDIDCFKKINDHYGHDVGDLVLCEVADILSRNVRQADVFGRWGGEEFVLVCPETSEERLRTLAEKLREAVAQHAFQGGNQSLKVSVSVGATTVNVQETFEVVFKRADTALYRAKNGGRNQVQFERR